MDIRKFWVDIEDGSGNRYGDGPLRARVFRVKKPLSESGDFALDILGSDPNIDALQIKRVAICRYLDASGATQTLGGGIVDKIVAQLDPNGLLIYQVSGNDLTRELFYRSVGSLKLEAAGVGVTNGPDLIMAYAPAGWTINSGATTAPVYLGFAGESVLAALIKCAENAGEHWRLGSGREIDWIGLPASFVSSGVRAVQHLNDAISAETLASLAVVMALNETHDSAEVLSRVIPIGSGIGGAATTLANATDPAPSGYTLDTVNNYLKQNAAEAAYGRIEKSIEFKDLGPLGATGTDAASASNALLQAAYQHLERFKAPAKFYDVAIWTNAVLEPGQTIQIIYRKLIDSAVVFDLNGEFIILSVEQTIDEQGLSTTKMMVATVDRKPATDADIMLDKLQQSNNLQTNRQQLLAGDIVGLGVVIGSGTPGHVAQWDASGGVLEDSNLIKSGAGVLTLDAAGDYTLTVSGAGSVSGTNTGDSASISTGLLTTRGDIIRRGASVPERYGLVVPAAGVLNYLGVANGETDPSWKSASSNPGAAASLLASDANGYLALTRLGIGIVPTVGLQMYGAGGANPTFYIGNSTTAQPFSAIIADTTVAGAISLAAAGAGGLFVQGLTDTDSPAFVFRGLIGSTAPTIPAVQFRASKWNGTTSVANLAAGETAFLFTNSSATQEHLRIMGNGYVGIGIAAPASALNLGSTAGTAASGITFGTDVTLYRSAADMLKTDDSLTVDLGLVVNESGAAAGDLRAESDTEPNMLWLDANGNTDGTLYVGGNSITTAHTTRKGGVFYPVQAPTASAPTYVKGGVYFDTTLNKLRIGGATAWETVTSV